MATIKTVLLVGGSGFLGGWVAGQLAKRGIRVRVPTRDRKHCKWLLPPVPSAEFVQADVSDPATLLSLMQGVDAVVNLVGILHDRDGSLPYGKGFSVAHVGVPQQLIVAMRQCGVRRAVHVSALCAAADAPSAYLRSKAAGEAVWLAARDDVDVTIFRPSVIFGANDAFLNMFAALLLVFPVLPLAGADARFQPVFVEDVAAVMVDALERDVTFGQVYELGGPRVYTLRELVAYTAALQGRRRLIIGLPRPLAQLQATLLSLLPDPPMTPDNLRSMQLENVTDGRHNYPDWQPVALESVAPGYLGPHG